MKYFYLFIILLLIQSCSSKNSEYKDSIDNWHKERIESLTSPYGWLSLTGLHWIPEDVSSFGSGTDNDIVLNTKNAPEQIGSIFKYGETIGMNLLASSEVLVDGETKRQLVVSTDADENMNLFTFGSVQFYVIKRDDKYGIRVKDSLNPLRTEFKGIERFDVNEKYKINATFRIYDEPKQIKVRTSKDVNELVLVPGEINFEFDGKEQKILPFQYDDTDQWFIVFADQTSGKESYEACRFLYVDKANEKGELVIDFNKSYNPPCVFTDYATCPLPPKDNILNVEIKAGEKKWE